MPETLYSVAELTETICAILEGAPFLQNIALQGEVSGLSKPNSGHFYFNLKDEDAQIRCTFFGAASRGVQVANGDLVEAKGSVGVYKQRGEYQFKVSALRKQGQGELLARYLQLKEKLQREGLFDNIHKKPLPEMPRTIALVTSGTGAVLQDMQYIFKQRFPLVKLLLFPTLVQGVEAPPRIARALQQADDHPSTDLIILARGGGSTEDLMCFNSETVARTVFGLTTPIISAIGHESDYSLTDFVADMRASTPTAAANLAVPNAEELLNDLESLAQALTEDMEQRVQLAKSYLYTSRHRLDRSIAQALLARQHVLQHTGKGIEHRLLHTIACERSNLALNASRLHSIMARNLTKASSALDVLDARTQTLDTRAILKRGFSITMHEGKPLRHGANVQPGHSITTHWADGTLHSTVWATQTPNEPA